MSPLRIVAALALIAAAVPLGLHLARRAAHSLQALPRPDVTAVPPADQRRRTDQHRERAKARENPRPTTARSESARARATAVKPGELLDPNIERLLILTGLELAAGTLLIAGGAGGLAIRRVRRRRTRRYGIYELRLSTHDEAKPQDLEDMVEAIANLVRAFPVERARNGQPHVSLELTCAPAATRDAAEPEAEWSLRVRCEPAVAGALDAAVNAAYPDVRLDRAQRLAPDTPGIPRHVMRFRKQRSFVYPLAAADETLASPPLEQIALAQVALGTASVVRFQLTPAPAWFEALARRLYRRHENRLVRAERWGLREGGLTSTLNRSEMRHAEKTQNRSLFWLELAVAADSLRACKTLAATVQARRGENRLQRRYLLVRRRLYRRRFPRALAPLLPSPRALVSAAEVAHLLELPSARMKGVPVRRATVPRIPAPPEALRADDLGPIAVPGEFDARAFRAGRQSTASTA